jgi:hypothetical protein
MIKCKHLNFNLILVIFSLLSPSVLAQNISPLELKLLNQSNPKNVININSFNQKKPTNPSLWWLQEQDKSNLQLINNWLAYTEQKRIDFVVNRNRWNNLDYISKYSFVHKTGSKIAQEYGYNIRIFIINEPQKPIATYTCDFKQNLKNNSGCQLKFLTGNREGLRMNKYE